MSRELRNILYVVGALLMVGGIVLAFLPAGVDHETVFRTVTVNCGSPLDPAYSYGAETPGCADARSTRGIWAGLVGVLGIFVVSAVAYLTYFAKDSESA